MRITSPVRSLVPGAALALLLAMTPQPVVAQCTVSGPDQVCGSAELCGPETHTSFRWTGPGGFAATTRCVTVTEAGTYSLRSFDPDNGLWFNCSKTLTPGGAVPNAITGSNSGCAGGTVNLCGPGGAYEYAWSGPNFSATTACVDVVEAGTYSLVVRDPASGCSSLPAEMTVAFERCGPPTPLSNCPRPACFWARPCMSHHSDRFSSDQVAADAACIDGHASSLNWPSPTEGMCRTLLPREWNLRTRAGRQFAAVLANVCASELQLAPLRGPAVGLDPATQLSLADFSGALGDWILATDASMAALQSQSLRLPEVKEAYRRIIRAGWNINHGRGMGATCGHGAQSTLSASADASYEDFLGDESLESALQDESDAPLVLERLGANPLASNTVIAFTLSAEAQGEVSIGVYDISGRMVRQLVKGALPAGRHETQWDGRDASGVPVHNGMYFVLGRVGAHRADTRISVVH